MAEQPRRIQVGEATVTIINAGDLRFSLRDELAVPEEEWRPAHADAFAAPLVFPSQCFHIAAPGLSLMVDAGRYDVPEGSGFAIPGYLPRQLNLFPQIIFRVSINQFRCQFLG